MSVNLLIGAGIIVIGTLLSTNTQRLNYQDQIIKLRRERQGELNKIHADVPSTRQGEGRGKLFYINRGDRTREERIRKILQSIFRTPFLSVRPSWLINPSTGRR